MNRMGVGSTDVLRLGNFFIPMSATMPAPSACAFIGGAGAFLLALCTRRKHA